MIFNRYGLPHSRILIEECKAYQIPTIYFIDDDLLNIPTALGNVVQEQHDNQEVVLTRKFLLENADLIYASTQYLAEKLAQVFPTQPIFHGAYPPYLKTLIQKQKSKSKRPNQRNFKFGYMGSRGHQKDLNMIAPAIAQILSDYPQVEFETFGTISMPSELFRFKDRISSHPVIKKYEAFLQYLYELSWDLGLAPLEDTKFNRCKSPIKYLEYTACGIPTIASNLSVYSRFIGSDNGILANPEDWYKEIEIAIKKPNLRKKYVRRSHRLCVKSFRLRDLENQLLTLIYKATSKNF